MSKLTKKAYLIYGLGVSYFVADAIFVQWLNFFYLPSENSGMTPILTVSLLTKGYIIIRLIDAITDPIVGYLSDHSKSRFGKRSKFMILGGVPLAISMVLFFYPIRTSLMASFIYFVIIGSIFFVSYTLVGGPYNALVADLSSTKEERINISTVQAVFRVIFSALPMIFSGILITKFSPVGAKYSVEGFRKMAIVFAVILVAGVYICAFFLNEKEIAVNEKKVKGASFRETIKNLKNKDVLLYFLGLYCFFSGFNIIRTALTYYVSIILNQDAKIVSNLSTLLFVGTVVFFPITNKFTKKFGYKKIMIINLLTIIAGIVGMLFVSESMLLVKIFIFIIGAGICGAGFIFPPAMLSEIATKLSQNSGVSVEGLLFGIQGFFLKLAFMTKAIISNNALVYKAIPNAEGLKSATYEGTILTLIIAIILFSLAIIFYGLRKEI